MTIGNLYYRVCVINDFNSRTSVCDFNLLGSGHLRIADSWSNVGSYRGYQLADDAICLFINFKQVFKTKDKSEAKSRLIKIIAASPPEFVKNFTETEHYLYKGLK